MRLCSIIFIICARKHWLSVAQENKPKILNAQEKKTGTVQSNQNKIDEKFSEVVETANIAIRNINESSEGVLMNKNDRRMRITKAVQIPITKIEWNWFLKRNTKNFRKQNLENNNFGTKPLEIFQKWLNLSQRRKNEESRNSKIP